MHSEYREMKIEDLVRNKSEMTDKSRDYQQIAEDFLELTRGKFVALNLYDADGKSFTTTAIAGEAQLIQHGLKLAGLCIKKMKWNHDEVREQKMKGRMTTRFSSLEELTGEVLSRSLIRKTTERLNIGETVVIRITNKGKKLGDFTLFMPAEERFKNQEAAEIFCKQVGRILEHEKIEKQVTRQSERLLKLTREVPGALFQCRLHSDGTFEFPFISDGVQEVCEVSPREVRDNADVVFSHIHPDDYEKVMQAIEKSAKEQSIWDVRYRVVLPKKGERWLHGMARPESATDGSILWNGYINDYSEYMEQHKKIEFMSMHDDLTGLYNRRLMELQEKRLDREENLPLAYFYIDVNGLKLTNDAFGHKKGDELLKLVAKALENSCRKEDIVARVGGDEFSILLPKTSKSEAAQIAERIQLEIANTVMEPVRVSIAMGYAVKTDINEHLENIRSIAEKRMYKNKRKDGSAMRSETIAMILQSIEEKHQKEEIHSLKVGEYAGEIAAALGFDKEALERIKRAAYLHDIGKVMVAPEILNKPGLLNEEERELVQQHAEIGYQILKSLEEYGDLAEMVLFHHERWDGTGYPQGLKGEDIPLGARIICVADAYEAMTADRPYRKARSKAAAVKELQDCAGSQFDPEIVRIFIEKITDLQE